MAGGETSQGARHDATQPLASWRDAAGHAAAAVAALGRAHPELARRDAVIAGALGRAGARSAQMATRAR